MTTENEDLRTAVRRAVRSVLTGAATRAVDCAAGFLLSAHPEWSPRAWSNRELRRIGALFDGDVLNVSAAQDGDKGTPPARYRTYFPRARSYRTTNYGKGRDGSGVEGELILDLSAPYAGGLGQYDVVLSHTVIEHVFDSAVVLDTLCALSRDVVITVVPFLQCLHGCDGVYADYWRYSPYALEQLFRQRGFETLHLAWNDDFPLMNVYQVHVASRRPEAHRAAFAPFRLPRVGQEGPGVRFSNFLWGVGPYHNRMQRLGRWLGCRLAVPDRKPAASGGGGPGEARP